MASEDEMTLENHHQVSSERKQRQSTPKRRCLIAVGAVLLMLLLLLFVIALILALTVFKAREPRTQVVSAAVEGIAPRVSLPLIRIQLNITLDLKLLVENPNHASFKHGTGKSVLLYNGHQVGEADIFPGNIPARGSTTLACRLTLQVDELASDVTPLIRDVLAGELLMETHTRIPGRVSFLGILRKHAVAISDCQIAIGIPDMKIRRQDCKQRAKL
ncbi:hypothetical protein L1049_008432 [Liquidambar formosana]|uniref:Late embryogenesis abundant protein LEA-2 subgroup domain-containing protein n=1 Tax=Liquidambar formosana TaxID=63359 RepID=A0AAP0S3M4_LIQFO